MDRSLADAVTALTADLDARAASALLDVGQAWAAACTVEAPKRTGRLRGSFQFVPTGPLSGEVRMVYYGTYVREGVPAHAVSYQLKAGPRRAVPRAVMYLHPGQQANDFAARAWHHPEVAEALARHGWLGFTPGL